MTRSAALRPTRAPGNHRSMCASLRRIAFTSAAGFAALFLATALFWK